MVKGRSQFLLPRRLDGSSLMENVSIPSERSRGGTHFSRFCCVRWKVGNEIFQRTTYISNARVFYRKLVP
jgi:hypothetical protein